MSDSKKLPFVSARRIGDMVFVSGCVGFDEETKQRGTTFEDQVRILMKNLIDAARSEGMEPQDFVKCTAYLEDLNYFDLFDGIYGEFFKDGYPARSAFAVPKINGPYQIEVDGFGFVSEKYKETPKEIIKTLNGPRFPVALCQGVKVGDYIFPSGQVPAMPEDSWPVEGFEEQIRRCIQNLIAVVEAAGGKKEDIVKTVIFLKRMDLFPIFNKVYGEFFDKDKNPPARSCFGVTELAGPYDMEIEGVAYIGDDVERLFSPAAPVFDLPFCQGTRAGDLIYVSGQVGYDQKTGTVPTTFEGQTRQMMENMFAVAKAGGADPKDFIKCTCFLTDIRYFQFFNNIYKEYFGEDLPARTTFQVAALAPGYHVEIDGIAVRSK